MVGQPVPGNLSRIQDPKRTPHGVAMAGAGRARPAPRTEGRHLALRPAALRTRDGSGGSAGDMLVCAARFPTFAGFLRSRAA